MERKLPFWKGYKPTHTVLLALTRHSVLESAQSLVHAMRSAKVEGRPFHVFFEEAAEFPESDWRSYISRRKADLDRIRFDYSNLINRGKSEFEARDFVRSQIQSQLQYLPFAAELYLECALQEILVVPIEAYGQREIREFERLLKVQD